MKRQDTSRKGMAITLLFLASLALILGGCFDRRFRTADDVEKYLGKAQEKTTTDLALEGAQKAEFDAFFAELKNVAISRMAMQEARRESKKGRISTGTDFFSHAREREAMMAQNRELLAKAETLYNGLNPEQKAKADKRYFSGKRARKHLRGFMGGRWGMGGGHRGWGYHHDDDDDDDEY